MADSLSIHNNVPTAAPVMDPATKSTARSVAAEKPANATEVALLNKQVREAQQVESKPETVAEAQKEALKDSFSGLNRIMDEFSKSIRFATFEQSGELYAQVVNTNTNEVVKTIPSEEALEMMSRINNMLGMIIDIEG